MNNIGSTFYIDLKIEKDREKSNSQKEQTKN